MAYCAQNDLLDRITETELIDLTDDDDAGMIDGSKVTRAIADADVEIDSYCADRYTVPFSPVPGMIRKLSVDVSIYNLYTRRSALKMPDVRQKNYDNAVHFLLNVSKGLISLGADAPAPTTDDGPETTHTRRDRKFTIGKTSKGSAGTLDNY